MFGYYSAQAERLLSRFASFPFNVSVGPNGERVMAWFQTREEAERIYAWTDKVFVGEFDESTFQLVKLNPDASHWEDPLASLFEMQAVLEKELASGELRELDS